MPTIIRIRNIRIIIWPGDHIPPHVHLLAAGYTARVLIEHAELVEEKGKRPSGLPETIAWIKNNPELLMKNWSTLTES